jgi:hypothetical protein
MRLQVEIILDGEDPSELALKKEHTKVFSFLSVPSRNPGVSVTTLLEQQSTNA